MKKSFFTLLLSFLGFMQLMAQKEEVLLNVDCSIFEVSASKDMSSANAPHSWRSASGFQWESENVFAQSITEGNMNFIGKSIRFGSMKSGDGKAILNSIDLSAKKNQKIVIKIAVTAGGDKSGNLDIQVDGKSVGVISVSKGNKGKNFSRQYYPFEFEVKNGDMNSKIAIIHSSVDKKGYIYMNEFKIIKKTN